MIFVDVTHKCVLMNGWVRYESAIFNNLSPNGSGIWDFFCVDRLARKYDQIICHNGPITQYSYRVQFVPQFSQKST